MDYYEIKFKWITELLKSVVLQHIPQFLPPISKKTHTFCNTKQTKDWQARTTKKTKNNNKNETQYLVVGKFDDRLGTGENELVDGENAHDGRGRGGTGGDEEGFRRPTAHVHLLILQEVEFAESGCALQVRCGGQMLLWFWHKRCLWSIST